MVAVAQVTILDHIVNVGRKRAQIKNGSSQGEKRFKIVCCKERWNLVRKEIMELKTYNHVKRMMQDFIRFKQGNKFEYKPKKQAK